MAGCLAAGPNRISADVGGKRSITAHTDLHRTVRKPSSHRAHEA